MIYNQYKISIDLKNYNTSKTSIKIVQGDIDSHKFYFSIYDGTKIKDLTDINTSTITFKKSDDTVVVGNLVVEDAINGKLSYQLGSQEITFPGNVIVTLEFYGVNGERLTTSQFIFDVVAQLDDGTGIESTTEYTFLSTFIDNENARIYNEDLRISSENTRKNNELARENNENSRIASEDERVAAENVRENNESTRKTNDINRENAEKIRETNEDTRVSQENIRQTNETQRQSNFQQMLRTSNFILKNPVSNYSAIATTYPSPTNGWTVRVTDTGRVYRYNDVTRVWEWIDTISSTTYDALVTAPKYHWIENKTVNANANTLTLSNTVNTGQKLFVTDQKYGCKWYEGVHWNRSNQVITFTSNIPETLTFEIINIG